MAIQRFKTEKFATIELNHVSWPETARVFAQFPLSADFTDEKPCENGMWLVYDEAKGVARPAASADEHVGVMYLNEKEYNPYISGMNQWALKPNTVYPRIGMPAVNDRYTTNCFCYDTTEFTDETKVVEALGKIAATPLYLVVEPNQAAPKLTATKAGATAAQVVKFYTMPNGEPGIKVSFVDC